MYESSPAVQRAIENAEILAREAGHDEVGSVHLLRSLLSEDEGRTATLILQHGGNVESLRKRLNCVRVTIGHALSKILQDAQYLSRQSGDGTITSEFFFLALLRDDDLRSTMLQQGLNIVALEESIIGPALPAIEMSEPIHLTDPPEQVATARILDANANRARESLRILEDYCRFVLDDAYLMRELKSLRHELARILGKFPESLFFAGRETLGDVGTNISTVQEMKRESPEHVVVANSKRLQESLRTLEEFGKIIDPMVAQQLEQLRYRSYTLERALVLGSNAQARLVDARLYVLLTGSQCQAALDWTIQESAAGGADIFQLRENSLDDRALLQRAREVRRWTRQTGTLFILNDRPDIARLADADGVHLGQNDMSIKDARTIVGPDAIIGVSTHDIAQVRQAIMEGATYIGVGPTFPSLTKQFEVFPGLEFVRAALAETSLPAFVIGGINATTIGQAVQAGAKRIAVSSSIAAAENPRLTASVLREALNKQ